MADNATIAAALVKAQAAMGNAGKDSKNPHFKSKYADLASVRAATSGPLGDNGLAIIQQPETDDSGAVFVRTIVLHESGEMMQHDGPHVMPAKKDAQGVGSAITYLRRYNLMAVCGIASDDDDGNAASFEPRGNNGPRQDNAPREDRPAVTSRPRDAQSAPASKLVPLHKKAARNGREYDDWTLWMETFKRWMEAAAGKEDHTVAHGLLAELMAENSDHLLAFQKTDIGMNGGWTDFEFWKENICERVGLDSLDITYKMEAAE